VSDAPTTETAAAPNTADVAGDSPIRQFIQTAVSENPVVLFMKGEPDQPRCGFSAQVVQILDHLQVQFVGVDVLQNEALRQEVKAFSDWPTIPQLYVQGEFLGGSDIVREMFQAGELKTLLAEKGLIDA
jgi:monothiol glutaredoxin